MWLTEIKHVAGFTWQAVQLRFTFIQVNVTICFIFCASQCGKGTCLPSYYSPVNCCLKTHWINTKGPRLFQGTETNRDASILSVAGQGAGITFLASVLAARQTRVWEQFLIWERNYLFCGWRMGFETMQKWIWIQDRTIKDPPVIQTNAMLDLNLDGP